MKSHKTMKTKTPVLSYSHCNSVLPQGQGGGLSRTINEEHGTRLNPPPGDQRKSKASIEQVSNYSSKHGSDGGDSSNKDQSIRKQYEEQKDEKDNNLMSDGMQSTDGIEDANIPEVMRMRGGGLCGGPDEEMEVEKELEGQQKPETDEGTEDVLNDVREKQVSHEEHGETGGVKEHVVSTAEVATAQEGEDAALQPAAGGKNGKSDDQKRREEEAKEQDRCIAEAEETAKAKAHTEAEGTAEAVRLGIAEALAKAERERVREVEAKNAEDKVEHERWLAELSKETAQKEANEKTKEERNKRYLKANPHIEQRAKEKVRVGKVKELEIVVEYMGDMDGVTSSKTKSFKGAIDDLGYELALEPLVDATFANCKERAMSVLMRAYDEKLIKYDVDDKMNGTVWRVGPSVSNSPEVLERKSTDDTGNTTHLDRMESSTEKVSEQEHEGKWRRVRKIHPRN